MLNFYAHAFLICNLQCLIYKFLVITQLVKLLELREANHIELCRIKNVVDEILHMHRNSELHKIVNLLMDPTWVATGLKIEFETLVSGLSFLLFLTKGINNSFYCQL